jgi:hypothetical protein
MAAWSIPLVDRRAAERETRPMRHRLLDHSPRRSVETAGMYLALSKGEGTQ